LNYTPVTGLLGVSEGMKRSNSYPARPIKQETVSGVQVHDLTPEGDKRSREVHGRVVINASGVWADELRGYLGGRARLRRLRGSHLIFPSQRLPLPCSVNVLHPDDKRPVFAIPWEGVTIVGTTDTDHRHDLEIDPAISAAEVNYLLKFVQKAFPMQCLTENDIQATFSGIRPVVNTGKANPSKESREHVLWNESGMLSVTGGKLTTFRVMARQALLAVRSRLPGKPDFKDQARILDSCEDVWPETNNLTPAQRLRLAGRYGRTAPALVAQAIPDEMTAISGSVLAWAELRWACREAVCHLDDVLLRRTRLGLLLPEGGAALLEQVGKIVRAELGWDENTWQQESQRYLELWKNSYSWNA
jgi:glycerol-3-phosphate dehydrogenase